MARGHLKVVHPHHTSQRSANIKRSVEKRAEEKKAEIPDYCYSGSFYHSPTPNLSIDALAPLPVSWNPTCLPSSSHVDIYLYAPGSDNPRIHYWQNVENKPVKPAKGETAATGADAKATFELELMPRWWNAKQPQNLQVRIVPSGTPPFINALPAGPVFVATWTAPPDACLTSTSPPADCPDAATLDKVDTSKLSVDSTVVTDPNASSNKGKTAVAVLIPLLVIALGAFAFFKWKRRKELQKRKEWVENVDKRMSTISTDWKSVSVKGAQAAIRNSMAVGRNSTVGVGGGGGVRSSFSFGNIRPSGEYDEKDESHFAQNANAGIRRPGVGLRNPNALSMNGERVSRVSFAEGTRPSGESRRSRLGMVSTYEEDVPPVPSLPNVNTGRRPSNDSSDENGSMSPTQAQGAITLTPEDIRARIAAGRARADSAASRARADSAAGRARADSAARGGGAYPGQQRKTSFEKDVTDQSDGIEEMMPALKMMRTDAGDDYLFTQPAPPATAYPKPSVVSHTHNNNNNNTGDSLPNRAMSPASRAVMPLGPERTMTMSPVMNSMPMQAVPATVMSPDDLLRAYAERKKSMGSVVGGGIGSIGYPQPPQPAAAGTGGGGARTLFSGTMSPNHTGGSEPSLGFAPGEYDANFSFGNANANANGVNAGYGNVYQQQQQQDPYGGYDAAYGGTEVAEETTTTTQNFAGRGAFKGRG